MLVGYIGYAYSGSANTVFEGADTVNIYNTDPNTLDTGMLGASGTRFPNGISVDSTSPSAGEVRGTTLTITGAAIVGNFTQGGGITSTTTGAAAVLTAAEFDTENVILVAPTLAATTATTLTFPASSTLSTFAPTAGDVKDVMIQNSTTTTYALTLAQGAGMNFQNASTTLIINEGAGAMLRFIRTATTDFLVNIITFGQ